MSINAPQVRSGSLPTQTPRVQQPIRNPAPAQATEASGEGTHEESQPVLVEGAEKPKRKYNRKPKPRLATTSGATLSKEELAAWGEIALEANAKGISVERYMTEMEQAFGLKLSVWNKLRVPAEQPAAEPVEQAAVEA